MNAYMTPQQMASQGRYGDSMLMHVSPGEVKGLQALAMQNGTSLTINPTTGLPEAFKLKSLLPMIAGFALGPAGLALMPAWGAGLAVGGIEALRTGDLGRGLMAGLGAYGGAGLGEAFMSAGSQQAMTGEVARQAAEQTAAQTAAAQTAATQNLATTPLFGTQAGADAILQAGATPATSLGRMQMAGQGFSALGQPGGFSNLATGLGQAFPSTTAKIAAAAPATMGISEALTPKYNLPITPEEKSTYAGPYYPTDRAVRYPTEEERRRSTREFSYFSPSNPMPFADGGAVEDRAIRMPADVRAAGTAPEFNYNFRPVEIYEPPVQAAPASVGGKGAFSRVFGRGENDIVGYTATGDPIYSRNPAESQMGGGVFGRLLGRTAGMPGAPEGMSLEDAKKYGYDKYRDLSKFQFDPETQRMVRMAEGGSVPQLEDGGFVLTKKAVDGLGGGNNKQGQQVASMGLGALPIKGKGHGTSDSIPTTIDGKVPARVSNGEAYVPRNKVQKAGGAKKLYALMRKAERRA